MTSLIAQFRVKPGRMEEAIALNKQYKPIGERHGGTVRLYQGFAGGGPTPFTTLSITTQFASMEAMGKAWRRCRPTKRGSSSSRKLIYELPWRSNTRRNAKAS